LLQPSWVGATGRVGDLARATYNQLRTHYGPSWGCATKQETEPPEVLRAVWPRDSVRRPKAGRPGGSGKQEQPPRWDCEAGNAIDCGGARPSGAICKVGPPPMYKLIVSFNQNYYKLLTLKY
jgi:hypothetical protein